MALGAVDRLRRSRRSGCVVLRVTAPLSSRVWRAVARVGVVITAAAAQAIFATPDARGDLFLVFKAPVAHPGQTVVAFYGDPTTGRPEPVTSVTGTQELPNPPVLVSNSKPDFADQENNRVLPDRL